ncbi:MAG: hypothetical protein E7337_06160 [Clostridiales bacterium]|nr:hypothetical protein [Clostridiales bacterium]
MYNQFFTNFRRCRRSNLIVFRSENALKRLILLILLAALCMPAASASVPHTRDEVRNAYLNINDWWDESPYAEPPSVTAPYRTGAIHEGALSDAVDYLNFLRWLAYIDAPVSLSRIYDFQCQHGAVLLAALDRVSHDAPPAEGMDRDFYESAHNATLSGNIAKFNWMRPSIIREGVEYFIRDDGDVNLPVLGHRRWALNPLMGSTGFGLANSESGMSYVVMYAHDFGNAGADWTKVCWPSEGAFPADFMHADLAWSVSLNPDIYDVTLCTPIITLKELESGLSFRFDPVTGNSDGFCAYSMESYGAGPCLIFRPDLSEAGFSDYQQNQRWQVTVNGLYDVNGKFSPIEYTVEMISLFPQDPVNVEISDLEATVSIGDTLALSANVIPAYADDLSVTWKSSDESVAIVDENGFVTAIAPGYCDIIASSANGREDYCVLTVE